MSRTFILIFAVSVLCINAKAQNVTVFAPTKTDINSVIGHECVDLGLSVKWAICNIGANEPNEVGEHYSWGEVIPKEEKTNDIYKWSDPSKGELFPGSVGYYYITKYNNDAQYGNVDNKNKLEPMDDAATVKWGDEWRIPTYDEWNELRKNCKWIWTSNNGVVGYMIESKKNGNAIFLPADGDYESGHYWASTLSYFPYCANSVDFNAQSTRLDYYPGHRDNSISIRPVTK